MANPSHVCQGQTSSHERRRLKIYNFFTWGSSLFLKHPSQGIFSRTTTRAPPTFLISVSEAFAQFVANLKAIHVRFAQAMRPLRKLEVKWACPSRTTFKGCGLHVGFRGLLYLNTFEEILFRRGFREPPGSTSTPLDLVTWVPR